MNAFRRSMHAWIALLGIIFSQLAMAAHACPALGPVEAHVHAAASGDAAAAPCPDMDSHPADGAAVLCAEHCDPDEQTAGSPQVPDFQPGLFLVHILAPLSVAGAADTCFIHSSLRARSTSPPPLWRTGRLRI
jgi:hypothetical protein